jgi:uncharacterized membrane protein YbhN (UPF0104 family)
MQIDATARTAARAPRAGDSKRWTRVRRWATPVFGVAVLGLLLSHAHKVDWAGAWQSLRRTPTLHLLAAYLLSTGSHALYGCFDLLGRHHTRHGLTAWRTWAIAVTSYAFNLNLGSLVGSVATRARLYAREGLDDATIAQVVGMSLATNWLGWALLGGGLFAAGVVAPRGMHLDMVSLRLLGVLMMLIAAGYVAACALSRGRTWRVRGRRLHLPSARLALLQLGLATANWALMGTIMFVLLGGRVPYATVLGVLMAASIAGVVTPIPAGLGVLEAVYLTLLAGTVPQGDIMGAVLAYRALYYLLPLGGGVALYFSLERDAAKRSRA